MSVTNKELAAIHEAGHVVAAFQLGVPLGDVSLMGWDAPASDWDGDPGISPSGLPDCKRRVIALAGPLAEARAKTGSNIANPELLAERIADTVESRRNEVPNYVNISFENAETCRHEFTIHDLNDAEGARGEVVAAALNAIKVLAEERQRVRRLADKILQSSETRNGRRINLRLDREQVLECLLE